MNTNTYTYNTRKRERERNNSNDNESLEKKRNTLNDSEILKKKLDDVTLNYINNIMKISFDENYTFSYETTITSNDPLTLYLYLNIDNDLLDQHVSLSGHFFKEDDIFGSQIDMIESNLGYRVGSFLLDIFVYISILIGVNIVKLENETDDPLRASKGIYQMFEPLNEDDENRIEEKLKSYFDNYENLDEIYGEDKAYTIRVNLEKNKLFNSLKEQYDKFDDIPETLQNDIILEEILRMNDGIMIYKVNRNSLSEIKNKIYNLIKEIESNDNSNNPWNSNISTSIFNILKKQKMIKQKIIGGKKMKHKTKKYKIKNRKTKNRKIKNRKTKKYKTKNHKTS